MRCIANILSSTEVCIIGCLSCWASACTHKARVCTTDGPCVVRQVLGFKPMFIMADMGEETTVAGYSEKVLAVLKAQPDGSLDMQPGFCAPGDRYRFEDDHGGHAVQGVGGWAGRGGLACWRQLCKSLCTPAAHARDCFALQSRV
jgi:hypothetical protein